MPWVSHKFLIGFAFAGFSCGVAVVSFSFACSSVLSDFSSASTAASATFSGVLSFFLFLLSFLLFFFSSLSFTTCSAFFSGKSIKESIFERTISFSIKRICTLVCQPLS